MLSAKGTVRDEDEVKSDASLRDEIPPATDTALGAPVGGVDEAVEEEDVGKTRGLVRMCLRAESEFSIVNYKDQSESTAAGCKRQCNGPAA